MQGALYAAKFIGDCYFRIWQNSNPAHDRCRKSKIGLAQQQVVLSSGWPVPLKVRDAFGWAEKHTRMHVKGAQGLNVPS
jgi:hypothetical protein